MGYKIILILFLFIASTCPNGYSESESTLLGNGISNFQKARYQDAVFWFTKLIEKEPFNAKAYKNRGVARLSLQEHDMAMEDIDDALNPDSQMDNNQTGTETPATPNSTSSPGKTDQSMDIAASMENSAAPSAVTSESTPPREKEIAVHNKFTIQLGAFLNSNNADDLIKSLKGKDYTLRVLELQDKKNRQWSLVRTGAFPTKNLAEETLEKIKKELKVDAVIRPMGKF